MTRTKPDGETASIGRSDANTAPTHDEAGVDLTQVRASLALTPIERLRENEDGIRLLEQLRHACRRARSPRPGAHADASVRQPVIEWEGVQGAERVRALGTLPPGCEVLVLKGDVGAEDASLDMSNEERAGIEAALDRFERSEHTTSSVEAGEQLDARIRAGAAQRK